MKKLPLCLAMGAALSATAVAAEGPTALSPDQMDGVTAGGFLTIDALAVFTFDKLSDVEINRNTNKETFVDIVVNGVQADADALANAVGANAIAEAFTSTEVNPVEPYTLVDPETGAGVIYTIYDATAASQSQSAASAIPPFTFGPGPDPEPTGT